MTINLLEYALELADRLDRSDKQVCADAVDQLIQSGSLQKVAQYVGVIGYVLKQQRAMANCIRYKRAQKEGSMQEVVLECLKEYQDGQDYHDTEWTSKYASVLESDPRLFKTAHVDFLQAIAENNGIEDHFSKICAVSKILEENGEKDSTVEKLIYDYTTLMQIASEGPSRRFFKEAAPAAGAGVARPQRGLLSRLVNPSTVSANPFSWSRFNRQKGNMKDAGMLFGQILGGVGQLKDKSMQVKNFISTLENVATQINNTDPDLGVAMQRLATSLSEKFDLTTSLQEANAAETQCHRSKAIGEAGPIIKEVSAFLTQIQGVITNLQTAVASLRKEQVVIGQGFAGGSSALPIVNTLDKQMQKLYTAPLNPKIHSTIDNTLAQLSNAITAVADAQNGNTTQQQQHDQSSRPEPYNRFKSKTVSRDVRRSVDALVQSIMTGVNAGADAATKKKAFTDALNRLENSIKDPNMPKDQKIIYREVLKRLRPNAVLYP